MAKLKPKGSAAHRRPAASVKIRTQEGSEITARGHLDEVLELRKGGTKITGMWGQGGVTVIAGVVSVGRCHTCMAFAWRRLMGVTMPVSPVMLLLSAKPHPPTIHSYWHTLPCLLASVAPCLTAHRDVGFLR